MRLSKHIAPHFHKTFKSKKVHQIDSGGRGSTKTSKNGIKVPYHMVNDDDCNVVIIRKHKNTLRQSVYAELKRGLNRLGLKEGIHFKSTLSPMRITILKNGNTAYFGGLDDYEKLKGMIADEDKQTPEAYFTKLGIFNSFNWQDATKQELIDYADAQDEKIEENSIKIVWLSEITEIKQEEDILQTIATFSRGKKDYFFVLYEYNPPRNKFDWVNKWTEQMKKRNDTIVTHSDYRSVPKEWLGEVFIQQALTLKERDENRYNHIYLGHATGIDGLIYNYDLIDVIDDLEENERILYIDLFIDSGHQVSATTYLSVGWTNKKRPVLLDTYYYSPNGVEVKKAPSEFSEDLWKFLQYQCEVWRVAQDSMIIDSAEGALRNQFFKDYGIRLKPVNKDDNLTMADHVQDLLSFTGFAVLNTKNNFIFLHEHKHYQWKEGSVEKGKPKPDKTEYALNETYYNSHSKAYAYYYAEHTCDAFKYGIKENLKKYGLKL